MQIGIIGTGDMGKLYAREFVRAGYQVNCCDLPEKFGQLQSELYGIDVNVLRDGVAVSRRSDLIFYLVEVENIGKVVAQYGPAAKEGAIVSSGTSVMTPAISAFERYLPEDVNIINWHWLFGPSVKPQGQTTVLVNHRSSRDAYQRARDIFETIGTRVVELPTYQAHDKITADTQAVTQLGFKAMGTAWKNTGVFPWENPTYTDFIDYVKILMCLRIYGGKAHVYAGLAVHNPYAREQIEQYSRSVSDLFSLMIQERSAEFRDRINAARDFVFRNGESPILLDDRMIGELGFGTPPAQRLPNSHLSLLAMADSWYRTDVNPYGNLICQTPLFRLRLGIVERLFRNPDLLEESMETALHNRDIRRDDLEFHTAVREWATTIGIGDIQGYYRQFEETRSFFQPRLAEGMRRSSELIGRLNAVA